MRRLQWCSECGLNEDECQCSAMIGKEGVAFARVHELPTGELIGDFIEHSTGVPREVYLAAMHGSVQPPAKGGKSARKLRRFAQRRLMLTTPVPVSR